MRDSTLQDSEDGTRFPGVSRCDAAALAGASLIEAIAEAVAARLEQCQNTRKRLLTLEQAADYLGMSGDTVERLVANGRLAPVRGLDRRVRFDIRDLDKLVEDSKFAKI